MRLQSTIVPITVPKQVGPHNAIATHDIGTKAKKHVAPAIAAVARLPPVQFSISVFVSFFIYTLFYQPMNTRTSGK